MKWEYLIITNDNKLDALGKEGWELINVISIGKVNKLYLKRLIPSLAERITAEQRQQIYQTMDNKE